MKRTSTKEIHNCKFISGKPRHILLDGNRNPFCARCGNELLLTQLDNDIINKIEWKKR